MNNGFFIYGIVASMMFFAASVYILFFDVRLHEAFGNTKASVLGGLILAYGIFRLWRTFKTKNLF
jgi:hypothetical protein